MIKRYGTDEYRISFSKGIRGRLEQLFEDVLFTKYDERKLRVRADKFGSSYKIYSIISEEGYLNDSLLEEDFRLAKSILNSAGGEEISINRGKRIFNWFGLKKLWNYITENFRNKGGLY